jgi:hypothetical protein
MFSQPDPPPPPPIPATPQQAKAPDAGMVRDTKGQRAYDQLRAQANTLLTSGSGAAAAPTAGKELLGQ